MTTLAKFLLLLTLLIMGAYVNHNAASRTEQHQQRQQRLAKLKASATAEDYAFMKKVLNASTEFTGAANSTPPTSLVVKDGEIIGEGSDRSAQLNDPSAHAELEAVKAACKYMGATTLKGSVLYTSSKPCPMCLALLYRVEVERIVYYMPADTTPTETANTSNRRIYEALKQDPAYRPIPELVLHPSDLEKLAGGDGRRTR
ncbi:Cytidine and deoxycytidylate deaminase zinc-binding region [Chryseolinea serpens]|uniref:Cytidine and deoxycytidylate deaminase zinc-binding region n=1 Tax=Chryseolinea serpens TaxID=947013 RepID=A0A1M5VJS1_9BACT|nr:deaminase [Chryseolinea serpens]SHH75499.1 Cytidine and deoxycytidylate deaminase zinc-binding region [Chryseolinea serpens]